MRIKVDLLRISKRNKIPINYLYEMSTLLRDLIYDSKPQKHIRNVSVYLRKFKYLTFSLLQVPKRGIIRNYIVIKGNEAYFYVSSPERTLLECVENGLSEIGTIDFVGVKFKIRNIRFYSGPRFIKGLYRFSTLSPIILKSKDHSNQKHTIRYLYATDDEFREALKTNLIRRFISYYMEVPFDSTFEIRKIHRFKPVTYQIRNRYYRGNRIIFDAYGSPELLKFAYESGLGEGTHLGFGMLKYLAQLNLGHNQKRRREDVLQKSF